MSGIAETLQWSVGSETGAGAARPVRFPFMLPGRSRRQGAFIYGRLPESDGEEAPTPRAEASGSLVQCTRRQAEMRARERAASIAHRRFRSGSKRERLPAPEVQFRQAASLVKPPTGWGVVLSDIAWSQMDEPTMGVHKELQRVPET